MTMSIFGVHLDLNKDAPEFQVPDMPFLLQVHVITLNYNPSRVGWYTGITVNICLSIHLSVINVCFA